MTGKLERGLLIIGSGALACLFGARLSAAGVPVAMLGSWEAGLIALRKHGVRLVDVHEGEKSFPVEVLESPPTWPVQYALVLVKSWQTTRAASVLKKCLGTNGLSLTLQNGFGNRETLVSFLGQERVALGVTTVGSTLLEPGLVRQVGEGRISLGKTPDPGQLSGWLKSAGFQVEFVQDTEALLWGKLIVNAAINPLTGLLRVPNGVLLQREPARALMEAAAKEAASVASALGIKLPYDDPARIVESVARNTAANRSSMLQDITRGGLTEIDAINGAIVSNAERLGVSVPVNRCLWQLVKSLELGTT
jgi:2-dehydropantoate 2-reductase